MAITFSTNMAYTRAGEGTPSDVLSAHNPLIWKFADGAIAANPTATVQIVIKNNAGATIYTSALFDAYLLDYSDPVAQFIFDATEIIKYIISTYFYKETSEVIEAENYGSEIEVTFKSYDDAVLEDTELLEYFASHALNQIGDEYGANIPRMFYNDTEQIAHFLGFPNHLFFFAPTTLSGEDPLFEILSQGQSVDDNLESEISNTDYDTLTTSGMTISSAINLAGAAFAQLGNNVDYFSINAGDQLILEVPALVLNSGELPTFVLRNNTGDISDPLQMSAGDNVVIFTSKVTTADGRIEFRNSAAANWECGEVIIRKIESGTTEGTLGLFMHTIDLSLMLLTNSILANMYSDTVLLKTWNITVFQPCANAVYIRFLTKEGYYMYFAFSPYPTTTKDQESIGNIINSFSEMALANSRNIPIGYRKAFSRKTVVASAVPIAFRRKLMDLFSSPAVYLWNGTETPDENLISDFPIDNYDTLTTDGTIIISAINIAGAGFAWSDVFAASVSEVIIVILELTLNSGELPSVVIDDVGGFGSMSNSVQLAAGFNAIELTCTESVETARLALFNSAASNYSTGKIVVKRAEVEADWIQLEGVEGSHNLREKKGADRFEATLVLPENYTQTLSGQNL